MELLKLLPAVLISSCLSAEPVMGLIGGQDTSGSSVPYTAYIAPSGNVSPLVFSLTNGLITSVAINISERGIIGGQNLSGSSAYAALVAPATMPISLPIDTTTGSIISVATNALGEGLIGGSTNNTPYAAFITSSGDIMPLAVSGGLGLIQGVALNDSSQGLIGGVLILGPYAARISPSGGPTPIVTPLTLTGLGAGDNIMSVAINASSRGLIGGSELNVTYFPYAAFVEPSGTVIPITLPSIGNGSFIQTVAINDSNQGLVGGQLMGATAYVASVSSSQSSAVTIPISLTNGIINSVAINASGYGIIGGEGPVGTSPAYAALISPTGVETIIATGLTNGVINRVAINAFGQGLIGGQDESGSQPAYAAIVSPSGIATRLNLGLTDGKIISVAILSHIPTQSLSGNNRAFANYINQYAPQDAFYFVPAFIDGTLSSALESAAPTRNACSLFTSMNNLFFLNRGLSNHLRNSSYFRGRIHARKDELTASAADVKMRVQKHRPYSLWFDGIGATSYQKPQKQTAGFNPITGAALLGFDAVINAKSWVGGGAAYSYTQIHEKRRAGHSHINQETLFTYGSYQGSYFYFDGALWGGLFQISQARNIRMSGFTFKSTSHPHGWQLSPHLEFGYHPYTARFVTIDPFVMIDWANSWQKSYKERGHSPFNASQKAHYSSMLRTELGSRFYQTLSYDAWRLTFQEKCSYVYKKPFRVGRVNAFLVGSPGTFTVETLTTPQNLGVAEFGMIFEPTCPRHPYGTISYQGEFGASYQSHQISLELAWNF